MADNAAAEKAGRQLGPSLVTMILNAFLGGLFLMLLLGILHLNVAAAVPALGYWTCVPLLVLGRVVLSTLTRTTAPRKVAVEPTSKIAIEPMSVHIDPEGLARVVMRGERALSRR